MKKTAITVLALTLVFLVSNTALAQQDTFAGDAPQGKSWVAYYIDALEYIDSDTFRVYFYDTSFTATLSSQIGKRSAWAAFANDTLLFMFLDGNAITAYVVWYL